MAGTQEPTRPIGWWLKEADAALDAAFDRCLHGHPVDRRGWQVLTSLSRRATPRSELVAALASFDAQPVVDGVVTDLCGRGWVQERGGLLSLTDEGVREQAVLALLTDLVRHQVAAALPKEHYMTLVGLLERLVVALAPAP